MRIETGRGDSIVSVPEEVYFKVKEKKDSHPDFKKKPSRHKPGGGSWQKQKPSVVNRPNRTK